MPLLLLAGTAWVGAFVLFLAVYGPMLTTSGMLSGTSNRRVPLASLPGKCC